MKRTLAANAAIAAAATLLAGLTACTSDEGGDKRATPRTCKGGTYTWSDVRQKSTLTGLAKPVAFKRKVSSYSAEIDPLKGARRSVSFTTLSEGIDAKTAIASLGRHLRSEEPLAPLGEETGDKGSVIEDATGDIGPGAYFAWSYADVVEANFTYRCGDAEPARGHVATWGSVGTGFLPCAQRNEDADAAALAAARERCPEGSLAAEK
ncbi:hypothetical protein ACFWPU_12925 [Streptomyces sp. NPDC058471]|uniref:hypothetical protein n=1 Tax=Streptomyces sp. NPDC058471 TaxID=3346516 RepID=UPI0036671F28